MSTTRRNLNCSTTVPTKVVGIWSRIGAGLIFAAGNSNGDIQMLEFATQGKRLGMSLLVNHDDNARDIAYTAGAEKALDGARINKWTIASIKNDWNAVFTD